MKNLMLTFTILLAVLFTKAQVISIAPDKNNILYVGLDNPLTIAVENNSCKSLIVKTDNGTISGSSGTYLYRSTKIGRADIMVYKKVNGKLKEIGRSAFRVKPIPDPIPKVGPSSGGNINVTVLKAQEYIRSDIEGFDFQAGFPIDSFTVCIVRGDTCLYKEIKNIGNHFNNEIVNAFGELKKDDTVIFKKIFARSFDGASKLLVPIVFFCN